MTYEIQLQAIESYTVQEQLADLDFDQLAEIVRVADTANIKIRYAVGLACSEARKRLPDNKQFGQWCDLRAAETTFSTRRLQELRSVAEKLSLPDYSNVGKTKATLITQDACSRKLRQAVLNDPDDWKTADIKTAIKATTPAIIAEQTLPKFSDQTHEPEEGSPVEQETFTRAEVNTIRAEYDSYIVGLQLQLDELAAKLEAPSPAPSPVAVDLADLPIDMSEIHPQLRSLSIPEA